jgi:hypothetical protein
MPGAPETDCTPAECRAAFTILGDRLDRVVGAVEGLDRRLADVAEKLGDVGERVAKAEQSDRSVWHEVRTIAQRLADLPEAISRQVERHTGECPGRVLALDRLTRDRTSGGRVTPLSSLMPESQPSGFVVPKFVLWIGIGLGLTIAVAGWAILALRDGGIAGLLGQ